MIQNEKILKEGTDAELRLQRHAISRAKRRALESITPENSHPQRQSLLFTLLPSEIRNLIFMYAVCQDYNTSATLSRDSHRGRPGHRHNACIDTALLRTCRLIYYETRSIPPGSTTHHMWEAPSESFNPRDWDHYLFHLSNQIGRDLYHLHVTKWTQPFIFSWYLRDHLHWKKLTWTLCASEWNYHGMRGQYFDVSETLQNTTFPNTCHEVTIEFESLTSFEFQRMILRDCAEKCKNIHLTRQDGTALEIDAEKSVEYTWEGKTFKPPVPGADSYAGSYVAAIYHVIRLCWRDKVPEREYMRYDRLDCLRGDEVHFMTQDEIEKDVEVVRRIWTE
ncbi:hypothetical protein DM02DRAFT_410336 [Periconia macrospinosa]|uniref:F-box domain-containing protein n=1 Tax=Periconia macrospinosa TaxID=97972 RepID=A0A2V1DQH3_9PLEO|nr:hypothetical protein DM02DRAFT_410336 [Periconia macrospinosa]